MSDENERQPKRNIYVSRYSRPIEFVSPKPEPPPASKKAKTESTSSSGDQVASFYRSIVKSDNSKPSANDNSKDSEDTWHCDSCEMTIPKSDYKRHIQGTAHMVSSSHSDLPATDMLTLNGSNVGFKMLRSQGWKYEEGLGPDSSGRRHPIATVLKQDRLGIGHQETGKKLVTHKYREIEKRAIERQRMLSSSQKDPGKEIARRAKAESEKRVRMLRYMKD